MSKAYTAPPPPRFILLFLVVLIVSSTGCRFNSKTVQGSGRLETDTRAVSEFTSVELAGLGELVLIEGSAPALTIAAEDNLLEYLIAEVHNQRLMIRTRENITLQVSRPIIYTVTYTRLNGVTLAGSGRITADNLVTDNLRMGISGSGTIALTGSSSNLTVDLSGNGNIDLESFPSKTAVVTLSGSGTISGNGNVRYVGKPQVTQLISGSGQVLGQANGE